MLGKLLKYEIRATRRIFLPLYGLIVVCALLIRTFTALNLQHANGMASVPFIITMIIYCLLIAATFVMTLIVTIQRFNKNLLGDEGYLSFTLPVKVHSQIDSKMIVSLLWTVVSLIVAVGSVLILASNDVTWEQMSKFWSGLGQFFTEYGGWGTAILLEAIVAILVGTLTFIVQIYASVSVGNFSSKHKLLAAFGTFIGFMVVEEIISSLLFTAGQNAQFTQWFDWYWSGLDLTGKFQTVSASLGLSILYEAVFGAAFYFFTNWLLSRKLNLE